MNVRDYLNILHVAERLKDTPRHCTTSKGRTESVAEHSWRISLMAFLLRNEFPEADIDRVIKMCLIHDLGECFTGDIPTFIKTDNDRAIEDSLLDDWVKTLPDEISEEMQNLYSEMEAQKTIEAKIFKALDKLEALIQHNESPLDTWSENEYELNKTYAFDTVEFSSWLTELRNAILEDTMEKIDKEYICKDEKGNTLIAIEPMSEKELSDNALFTHCLAVVKVGNEYLLGRNKWRNRYEIFGGCVEKGENARECILRECNEELGLEFDEITYIGAMKFVLQPDHFSKTERIEYGGLYGISIPEISIDELFGMIKDKEEITELAFYSQIKDKEPIALIDEKLLDFYVG